MTMFAKRMVAAIALVGVAALAAPGPAAAEDAQKHRWKLASAVTGNAPLVGSAGRRIAERIDDVTGGTVQVKFFEPGALVPALEVFDSVSKGAVDAGWHATGYIAGKIPAAAFFVGVPFGPYAEELLAWHEFGGGKAFYEDLYRPFNVKGILCAALAPEAFGWYRKEIKTVDDLKGLKIRVAGYGGQVLDKIGASTQLIAPGEIYQALERGVIDGAENSSPAIDVKGGYYQVADYYYFPGWHQPAAIWELIINMDKWNALSPAQQAQIEAACGDNIAFSMAEGEAAQMDAIATLKEKGVKFRHLPESVLAALREKWGEVVREETARDPMFKKVWDSLEGFRESYKAWKEVYGPRVQG